MFKDIKIRSEVDIKYFGERVKIEKELRNSEGRYVYQVSHKGVPYILKGFMIQLEHLNPEDRNSVGFFKASLMEIIEVFQEYYFGKAAEPFNPHIAAPLALDFTIDVARNKASNSLMCIEIIFEHGGEALTRLKSITLELTYNLMRQSANALSILHNLGIAHFDIKPGNMVYDDGKDLLKIIDMGSAFGSPKKKKLAATTVKIEGKVRSGTLEFAPPEVLLIGESIANNPNLGLSLASIDVYCWAMSFFAILTERTDAEMNSYYKRYRSGQEADYKGFMEIVKICFDCVMTKDSKEEELKNLINSLLIDALQYKPKERLKMKDIIDKMKLFEKEKKYTLNYSKTELKQNRNILKILTDSDDVDDSLNELAITKELRCVKCKTPLSDRMELTKLPCSHTICPYCLKEQINKALENKGDRSLLRNTTCPKCGELIPEGILITAVNEKDLNKIIKDNGLLCIICMSNHQLKELTLLNCGHLMNRSCLASYVKTQINRGTVGADLSCIVEGCGKPLCGYELLDIINSISDNEIKAELMSRLMRIRMKQESPINNEQILMCPKCNYPQVLNVNEQELACPNCYTTVCPECNDNPHPGIDCLQNMENIRNDEEVHEMMKKQKMKYCPSCKLIGSLNPKQCKFVYCSSAKCKNQRMYCNNCGLKLNQRDHWSHLLYNLCKYILNSYSDQCKVVC